MLMKVLARDAQAKLALIVAQCLSIRLSICVSPQLAACQSIFYAFLFVGSVILLDGSRDACV